MTRYLGLGAAVVGVTADIGLAIAKRLVEGGARVLLTTEPTARCRAASELGNAGHIVGISQFDEGAGSFDVLFAGDTPFLPGAFSRVRDGGAAVLVAPTTTARIRALASRLATRSVRVNAVTPGCLEGPHRADPELPLLGRLGSVEEVARAAVFLATEATFTTGARLPVDGGVNR